MARELTSSVDLYWLPLGTGGRSVRLNGRLFEAVVALREGRKRCDLYHSALVVHLPEGRFVIEQGPAGPREGERGVVAEGSVGARWAGRLRLFRYELRCWSDGVIPDIAEAVDSPQRLTEDENFARRLVALAPTAPTAVWGRDELRTGEMWNSNSVISWLLESTGLPTASLARPERGRAPGWDAGLVVSRAERTSPNSSQAPPIEPHAVARGCGKTAAAFGRFADGELADGSYRRRRLLREERP